MKKFTLSLMFLFSIGCASALETAPTIIGPAGANGGGAPTGAAGGDLAGTYPNPNVATMLGGKFVPSGPSAARTYTFPDTDATILYSGSALGIPASGTATNLTGLPMTTGVVGILAGTNGGTGINNGANTITLSGNLTTTGAFNPTFAIPSSSTWTFPAAGTLIGSADTGTVTTNMIGAANVTAVKMVNSGVHTGDAVGTFPAVTLNATNTNLTTLANLTTCGALTSTDGTTPTFITASGKTNTGNVTINGKTNGSFILSTADSTGQNITLKPAAQTVGAATYTLPDAAGAAQTLVTLALTQTLTNKTLTSPTMTAPALGTVASGTLDASLYHLTINTQASTPYVAVISDDGKEVQMTDASANVFNIDIDANVNFPIGTQINVVQYGAGATTISASNSGTTTIHSIGATAAAPVINAQYGSAVCIK